MKKREKDWIIEVTADENDADYVTEISTISNEWLEKIKPVIAAIKKNHGDYPRGEIVGKNEKSAEDIYGHLPGFQGFDALVPYGEYGIHSIDKIVIYPYIEKTRLL